MTTDSITHFVFVDFENVPTVDLGVVEGKLVHVTLLIGKKQTKLDLVLVRQIHRLAARVELVEVGASGHNALDLTLAYYLGQAVQRAPGAQFYIVSRDKDFEPMISHLHGRGIKVVRCDSFAALPFLPRPKVVGPAKKSAVAVKKQPEDRRAKVIARLRNSASRNRPATQKALLARIKTDLGKEATDAKAEDIFCELRDKHGLTVDDMGKVSYAAVAGGN